jgi:hypothetical protein
MSSKLKAGTSTSGAVLDADTTGILELQTGSTPTTAVTIDTAQNVGIGTASPTTKLYVTSTTNRAYATVESTSTTAGPEAGISLKNGNKNFLLFNDYDSSSLNVYDATSSAFRMRIDSSGNVGVGTTSPTCKLQVLQTVDNIALVAQNTNASFTDNIFRVRATRNTTNGTFNAFQYYNDGAGATRLLIYDSGNVANTNNSYGALSDAKLKENIVDATPKLEDLMQVKVRNYNFISDQTHKQIGVVAQELEEVFPALVEEITDRDAEGKNIGTTTKQVKYSVFVPMLIKALQELNDKVDAQALEIQALKGTA